jgi:hypothetical protein
MRKRIYHLLQLIMAAEVLSLTACNKTETGSSQTSQTTLVYTNDAFTPIAITINGVSTTIAVGGSATYTGPAGSSDSGTASTSGVTSSNGIVGSVISWTINDQFPASGTATKTLDVEPSYFFLKVNNTSSYNVSGIYVNYGLTAQSFDNIGFGAGTFNIGYYPAYTNSNVRCMGPNGGYWQNDVSLPGVLNQSYLFTLTN